ncbi:ATP-binding protein [Pelagibacterium sp.]|uniref:GAF domain-containing sensor histidine kinase n=1 Tax=Pelagibacterium sp. TaxID=1967288 RepID=UPI003A8CEE92
MLREFADDISAIQRIAAVPNILDIVCRSTGMGFAAVARVTEERWIACQVLDNIHFGLAVGGELKVESTLCHEVRQLNEVIVFDNASEDDRFRDHHTPRIYDLQSYISVPIVLPDGQFFGTLCAIDPHPHNVSTPEIVGTMKLFAELIAYHLDADEKLYASQIDLANERKSAEFREQFIAVLGHDLRNPLTALGAGIDRLLRDGWTERSPLILQLMKTSVARSHALVANVMDFARSRLGSGIDLLFEPERDLETTLSDIVDEMRSSHPECTIETHFKLDNRVDVDHTRIGQLVSNLLGNAVTHGSISQPIKVVASSSEAMFELSVVNQGGPISSTAMDQLFEPFYRGQDNNREGLGLGLYIASQIAKAHGGKLDVTSTAEETAFIFTMPVSDPQKTGDNLDAQNGVLPANG